MLRDLQQLFDGYNPWHFAIELSVIWFCVYVIFRFLQGTRGAGVIKGFAVVVIVATVIIKLATSTSSDAFTRLNFIYDRFLTLVAILLIVVFQRELRQAMGRLGHALHFRTRGRGHGVVDAVSQAVDFLSKSQFGALIAIERNSRLGELVEGGVELDAKVDARLLESIFWPNSPLHDLGVVIRGDRVVAASVQFPLVEEGALPQKFGSRHRAAAGLSLESDCLVVIVSEETGAISISEQGRLEDDIPRDLFQSVLAARLQALPPAPAPPAPAVQTESESSGGDPDEKQAA